MRNLVLIVFFLSAVAGFSQADKRNTKYSIRGAIGIPRTISSSMFRTAFNGVYEGNISINTRLFSNFFVGLGYQNTHFQNNKAVFAFYKYPGGGAMLSYNTRLNGHSGFLKLGYDKFFEKGYVSYSLNTGLMFFDYKNVNKDTSLVNRPYQPLIFNAPYLQPEMGINFMVDGTVSFSILLSYTTLFYQFDPRTPRFKHFEEVNQEGNRYFMSWINIGFGFNILLGKKK